MAATIGAPDLDVFSTGHPGLLAAISGIRPAAKGIHVSLGPFGVRSAQRLAVGDLGGKPVVALWPAELKEQAIHLYGGGLARPMIAAACALGWTATATPHLAFRNAGPAVRLYMNPDVDASEYARRWEDEDLHRVGAHSRDAVRQVLWPWLRSRAYVSDMDDRVLDEWLASYLGDRPAFFRAGLSLKRTCDAGPRPDRLRGEVDEILAAAGDPQLAAQTPGALLANPR